VHDPPVRLWLNGLHLHDIDVIHRARCPRRLSGAPEPAVDWRVVAAGGSGVRARRERSARPRRALFSPRRAQVPCGARRGRARWTRWRPTPVSRHPPRSLPVIGAFRW